MTSPAAVLSLVLATTAVGGAGLLWLAPTWGQVRHGYEVLTGATVGLLGWGAWAALAAPVEASASALVADRGASARSLLLAFTLLTLAGVIALAVRLPALLGRTLGIAGLVVGAAAFVPLAAIRADQGGAGGLVQGLVELALAAFLMGAIWVGMVLGHWYLVERRLSNRYMVWIAWVNVAAVVAGVASVLLSWRNPPPCVGLEAGGPFEQCAMTFAPILQIGSMTIVLGLGVLSLLALIAAFNVRLAREGGRSIQASTGMFYLAVILAPAVEFAAKVRFF